MILIALFALIGILLATILLAKRREEKKGKSVFILNLISRGDTQARELHHHGVRLYSTTKEKAFFLIQKQLPRYSKSSFNKLIAKLEENTAKYIDTLRDSHLLKKSDGISEFFKNMSDVEKGAGEINEQIYTEETITMTDDPIIKQEPEPELEPTFSHNETLATLAEEFPNLVTAHTTKPVKLRKPRKTPAKRKLKVVESIEL